jgi:hypothetical protein
VKIILLTAVISSALCSVPLTHAQTGQHSQLITHIEHGGLSFSIRFDPKSNGALAIGIPRRTGSYDLKQLPPVHLKVRLRQGAPNIVEGTAAMVQGIISNAGSDNIEYRFLFSRNTDMDDILSVEIRIGDQTYTAFTF